MRDDVATSIFVAAWRGVRQKEAKQRADFVARYLRDLRNAKTPDRRRSVITELVAEGLIEIGGLDEFRGEEATADLWAAGESDGWGKLRDLALFASAIGD